MENNLQIYWDETPIDKGHHALLERALNAGMAFTKKNADHISYEISVIFLPSEEIRRINNEFRGVDKETDVLSFPGFAGSPALGDIVICLETAERQAREYGHSLERELAFLAVHGLLHLLGYDHDTPQNEEAMCAAQEEILKNVGVGR
jgi:probable rRNA maturation factor